MRHVTAHDNMESVVQACFYPIPFSPRSSKGKQNDRIDAGSFAGAGKPGTEFRNVIACFLMIINNGEATNLSDFIHNLPQTENYAELQSNFVSADPLHVTSSPDDTDKFLF